MELVSLSLSAKATKQLNALPLQTQHKYRNAFDRLQRFGAKYPSLRTHRIYIHSFSSEISLWSSSASMALRFYWHHIEPRSIEVKALDSH
ncbi:MAG: hypothetical protein AAGA60_27105 [Cyanobacteria bacterium P01_E01_bin.42]